MYLPAREATSSPRPPRRLRPIAAVTLPQARWEHAQRVLGQKPITVEPAKFRPTKSLFYMTEIDDYDDGREGFQERMVDDYATTTGQSEISEEMSETTSGVRRVHDAIERQARIIAEKDFAQMERNWDKYMFEHMDENTAKFIILRHVHDGKLFPRKRNRFHSAKLEERRARLIEYLKKTYNITKLPNPQEIDLVSRYD